jgi:hypothetical protein
LTTSFITDAVFWKVSVASSSAVKRLVAFPVMSVSSRGSSAAGSPNCDTR